MVDYIRQDFPTEAIAVIRAGKCGQPQSLTQGGTPSTGGIDYGVTLQVEGDTDVLNGVYVKYTAAASSSVAAGTALDPLLVNIKASVTLTIDEAVIVLNAATHTSLTVATYSNVGGTTLTVTYDTNGTAGNAYTLVAAVGTVSGATLSGGQDTPAISLDTDSHTISLTQAVDQDFTLASGSNFQEKTIILDAKGAGNAVITANLAGAATTCTFNTANDFVILKYMGGEWQTVVNSGCTIA